MAPVPIILSQHAENAAFLWHLRSRAIHQPHYSLTDLAKLDLRVDANLDGLRIAGEAGWQISMEALAEGEAGEVFAAAVLAFESGDSDRIETVQKVGTTSPALLDGLVSALGWVGFPQTQPFIRQYLASTNPVDQRVGIAACGIQRQNPGLALLNAFASPDPLLRSRALRAAGELGLDDLLSETRKHLADTDDRCRFTAAWSVTLFSADAEALALLTRAAESLAVRRMDGAAGGAVRSLASRPTIIAAGAFGDPSSIPWMLEQMKVPELARVAGEAFTMITGVDIAFEDLDADKPEEFEAGPTENPEDEDVAMDPDEHLPWPEPALIAKWWAQHEGGFRPGQRYLVGQPITVPWCRQVLREGRQRQRAAAALEIALREPGQPLFNVAAPGFRQQQILGLRR